MKAAAPVILLGLCAVSPAFGQAVQLPDNAEIQARAEAAVANTLQSSRSVTLEAQELSALLTVAKRAELRCGQIIDSGNRQLAAVKAGGGAKPHDLDWMERHQRTISVCMEVYSLQMLMISKAMLKALEK